MFEFASGLSRISPTTPRTGPRPQTTAILGTAGAWTPPHMMFPLAWMAFLTPLGGIVGIGGYEHHTYRQAILPYHSITVPVVRVEPEVLMTNM